MSTDASGEPADDELADMVAAHHSVGGRLDAAAVHLGAGFMPRCDWQAFDGTRCEAIADYTSTGTDRSGRATSHLCGEHAGQALDRRGGRPAGDAPTVPAAREPLAAESRDRAAP